MNLKHCTLAGFLLCNIFTGAQAAPQDLGEGLRNSSPSKPLNNIANKYSHWSGVGLLDTPEHTCTATLLDTRDGQWTSVSPAYVITAGHCVSAELGTSTLDAPFSATVTFNYFDNNDDHKKYPVRTAVWSSMSGTDLAILELEDPLSALLKNHIRPLKLSPEPPQASHDVLNIGAPGARSLRLTACTQEVTRTLSGISPAFPGGLVNQCKDLQEGSSGSPMLDRISNEITAIVSEDNYGFAPAFLSNCFTDGKFNNKSETCDLQQINLTVRLETLFANTRIRPTWNGQRQELPSWNFKFTIDTPYYRYKAVRDAASCEKPEHYGAAVISDPDARIDDSVGPETGMHVLCIIGVRSKNHKLTNALLKNAFTHAVHLAAPAPQPSFAQHKNMTFILWTDAYPDFKSHYFYTAPIAEACGDFQDKRYKQVTEVGSFMTDKPLKVCSYASNESDLQPSATRFDLITPAAPISGDAE